VSTNTKLGTLVLTVASGQGVARDAQETARLFLKAYEDVGVRRCKGLSIMHSEIMGVAKDEQEARKK